MKILLLAGAHDIHCVRWANQLSENGNIVHLCYVSNHIPNKSNFNKGVIFHKLYVPAPYGYYLNVFQLRSIIRKIKPDVLNVHYASGYGTLGRLSEFSPYLLSVYGSDVYDFPYKNKFSMKIIQKNLKAADALASTSMAMANQTASLIEYPVSKIYITPFGVDTSKFYNKFTHKKDKEIIIGTIKKLMPKYGIKYGILAIDYLVKNILDSNKIDIKISYEIYGDGDEREYLEQMVNERNLQDIVKFRGRVPNTEVPDVLNKFDIFLGTSILDSESFGVAIVEAMACEVPVIVTDVDGFKEVVEQGATGVMVPRKDFKAIAEQIYNLIEDKRERERLGKVERERVLKEYSWIDNVTYMEQIYTKLIKNNLKDN